MGKHAIWAAAVAGLVGALPALAEGDAALGKSMFSRCSACHDAKTDRARVGPSLLGVVGRRAATQPNFLTRYTQAMKAAGEAGLVWDEPTLTDYLRSPKAKVPGTSMAFAGLKKDADIANIIAYLKADPKP